MRVTNIEEKLVLKKQFLPSEEAVLAEIKEFLEKDLAKDQDIEKRLENSKGSDSNAFVFDLLETDKIFHINTIKDICITYRLRFLDSKYFKGKIPQEAYTKIKDIEKAHDITLQGFKIMAPSKLFKLEDKDDPLLFAPIGNGYYYLIHKWGNDLHPLRKMLVWPFKGFNNLMFTTIVVSLLATFLVPSGLFSKQSSTTEFWMIFFFMFKWIAAVVLYFGFAKGKNFNPAIWNSKYFNA